MKKFKFKNEILKKQLEATKKWRLAKTPIALVFNNVNIIINPKVFSPKTDSVLLAKKMRINKGEVVIDTCAGSGIQTLFAAKKGASKIYSCDISKYAVENIKLNIKNHKLEKIVKIFETNLFPKLNIKADVIVANPPYTDFQPKNIVEKSVWDKNHKVLKELLTRAHKYLKPNGRIYISWANFSDFEFFEKLLLQNKYKFKIIASTNSKSDKRIAYRIYELLLH